MCGGWGLITSHALTPGYTDTGGLQFSVSKYFTQKEECQLLGCARVKVKELTEKQTGKTWHAKLHSINNCTV